MRVRLVLAAASLGLSGCIALPLLAPPINAQVSTGYAFGDPQPETAEAAADSARQVVTGRFLLGPHQLLRDEQERRFDAGGGYLFELFPGEPRMTKHGATLGLSYFRPLASSTGRMVFEGNADVLFIDGEYGFGGAFSIGAEWASFVSDGGAESSSDGAIIGYYHGEVAIGLEAELAVRAVGDAVYGTFMVGFTVRFPAVVAVLFVPLD